MSKMILPFPNDLYDFFIDNDSGEVVAIKFENEGVLHLFTQDEGVATALQALVEFDVRVDWAVKINDIRDFNRIVLRTFEGFECDSLSFFTDVLRLKRRKDETTEVEEYCLTEMTNLQLVSLLSGVKEAGMADYASMVLRFWKKDQLRDSEVGLFFAYCEKFGFLARLEEDAFIGVGHRAFTRESGFHITGNS